MTAAHRLAEWTTGLALDEVPQDVAEAAKLHLLDTLGCGLAAAALGVATEGRETMAELGGDDQATVIGGRGEAQLHFYSRVLRDERGHGQRRAHRPQRQGL